MYVWSQSLHEIPFQSMYVLGRNFADIADFDCVLNGIELAEIHSGHRIESFRGGSWRDTNCLLLKLRFLRMQLRFEIARKYYCMIPRRYSTLCGSLPLVCLDRPLFISRCELCAMGRGLKIAGDFVTNRHMEWCLLSRTTTNRRILLNANSPYVTLLRAVL